MPESKYPNPPPGTHICGGSWEKLPEESREELWSFHDYIADGGKNIHGSFEVWEKKRKLSSPLYAHGTIPIVEKK